MRRLAHLSLLGTAALLLTACGLVLGLPSADDVKPDFGVDGSTDAPLGADGDAALATDGDATPPGDGSVGAPEPLLPDDTLYFPSRLALDGSGKLYFIDTKNYSVVKIDLGTKNFNTTVVATANPSLDYLTDLAADPSYVYFTNYRTISNAGGIYRCAATGCGANPSKIEATSDSPHDVELDGTTLYATFYGVGVVRKTTNPSGTTPTWSKITAYTGGPTDLAQQGSELFFSDYTTNNLYKCSVNGCPDNSVPFVTGTVEVPALDLTNVYWSERGQNDASTIWSIPRGGGTKAKIVEKQPWIYALTADSGSSGFVYYATRLDSKVQRCPKTGTCATPTVIATGIDAYHIVTDATYVYYCGGGNVFRVKK